MPWNKGKVTGQKPPLKPREVWAIRVRMRRVELDLGTRIDWVAAVHHDTGHPHVHLLMRGVDDQGRDLVMSREYVSHGFRGRAEELLPFVLFRVIPANTFFVSAEVAREVQHRK